MSTDNIQNLNTFGASAAGARCAARPGLSAGGRRADPFAEVDKEDGGVQSGLVHVRVQQRNGRKTLTTVQGLSEEYDKKKLVKAFKKVRARMSAGCAVSGGRGLMQRATGLCL